MEVAKRFKVKKSVIKDMNMTKEMRDYFEIISFHINFKLSFKFKTSNVINKILNFRQLSL